MNILILGAGGMLGHTAYRLFAGDPAYNVVGTLRLRSAESMLPQTERATLIGGVSLDSLDKVAAIMEQFRPDAVLNCIGIIKQLDSAKEAIPSITVNALLPHRLASLSQNYGARLIHISTDCVFEGTKGLYREEDLPDATDLYGRSKLLGEVTGAGAITLRTSIIGPELTSARGLVGWFLSQTGQVKGFTQAIFSGLTTVELARVIREHVLPHPNLDGLYHVSVDPISKYDLLRLVADRYRKQIIITPDDGMTIDRSLDSSRFRDATGYAPPAWEELVTRMYEFG
jgi:dTDP-4-dehydrorhamnose reductase